MNRMSARLGVREGWISIVVNTALFALKYWIGLRIGSVAMIADAWHTLSDTLTSVVVIVGFWISSKPADARHPFGHARAESIASLVIGVLLGVVGADFMVKSVQRLATHETVTFSLLGIVIFAVSILLKEGLAQYAFRIARKTGSPSVRGDAWHHRTDAIASALIVAGALLGGTIRWMDGLLGSLVSLLILYAAFDILRATSRALLGEAPSEQTMEQVRGIIQRAAPEIQDLHHLHIHRYGDRTEMTAHLRMAPEITLREAHDATTRVEVAIRAEMDAEATIHTEPIRP